MMFKVGDKVSILDENAKGIIVKIYEDSCEVEIDGFEYNYPLSRIVSSFDQVNLSNLNDGSKDLSKKDHEKSVEEHKVVYFDKKLKGQIMQLDLHFHEIAGSDHYTSYDKLCYQLDYFKRHFEIALQGKFKKVIAIHGKGEGVLKTEIRSILQGYDKIIFHDAPYSQGGATEIIFL